MWRQKGTLWSAGLIRLFVYSTILLSAFWRIILKHWHYIILVPYILLSLCLRLYQFSHLYFMKHTGLWVFSLHISLGIIMRICVLYLVIVIKSEIWIINHCLGLSHEPMVCTDCLACFICAWFALVAFCCGLWFPKCYCCSSEINRKCIKLIQNNKPQKIYVHIW